MSRNRKTVNLEYLNGNKACKTGVDYWLSLDSKNRKNVLWLLKHAIDSDKYEIKKHANWLVCHTMSSKNKLRYAINAAELVIDIYESKYPENKAGRGAIESAKRVLNRATRDNKAHAAAAAAYAHAAWAAYAAAYAAADSAHAAAWAAAYAAAAYAAAAAAYAAADSADSAAWAAAAAYAAGSRKELMNKCFEFAVSLYERENNGN